MSTIVLGQDAPMSGAKSASSTATSPLTASQSEQSSGVQVAAHEVRATEGDNKPVDPAMIVAAVERLNEEMVSRGRSLAFREDEVSGQTVVTVYNKQSNEVIRQIPSAEALSIAHNLQAGIDSAIIDLFA